MLCGCVLTYSCTTQPYRHCVMPPSTCTLVLSLLVLTSYPMYVLNNCVLWSYPLYIPHSLAVTLCSPDSKRKCAVSMILSKCAVSMILSKCAVLRKVRSKLSQTLFSCYLQSNASLADHTAVVAHIHMHWCTSFLSSNSLGPCATLRSICLQTSHLKRDVLISLNTGKSGMLVLSV